MISYLPGHSGAATKNKNWVKNWYKIKRSCFFNAANEAINDEEGLDGTIHEATEPGLLDKC